jgi:hypothetical protein
MLDLDDPNVRISPSLPGYVSVRIGLGDRDETSCPHPHKLAILSTRLRQHRTALDDAAVELEQDSSGIAIAAGDHGDRDCGKVAPPDQRLDPYSALQSCFQRPAPGSAALRRQGQAYMDRQSLRLQIFSFDCPAHCLDIAASNPQPDPEIA